MKTAAKPAVSSSDAGISASSSRLRALIGVELPALELRARGRRASSLRAQLVVDAASRALARRQLVDRHAGLVVTRVEVDPAGRS